MNIHKNENGGTLSLVLLVSMIMSIIVISLIALFGQTNLVTAQAGTQERAYADADSVIRIVKRSMLEVIDQSHGISAEGVAAIIDEVTDGNLPALNRLADNELSVQLIGRSKVRAEAEHGRGKFKRKQVIELSFSPLPATDDELSTGTGGNGFGEGHGGTSFVDLDDPIVEILNHPVVTPLKPEWDYQKVDVLFNVCNDELDPIGSIDDSVKLPPEVTQHYNQIYEMFVNKMLASGPAPIDADTTGLPLFHSSDYTNTSSEPQPGFARNGNLNFRGGPQITIDGDVIITGNATFNSYGVNNYNVVINGDLIVGGNISMNNSIPNFTVTGTVSAGGNITFQSINNLSIGGSLIAGGDLTISGHGIQQFTVGKDVRANHFTQNSPLKNMHVGGTMYMLQSFTMNHSSQKIESFHVDGSLYVGGNNGYYQNGITLNASINNITIRGDMMTNGKITINHSVGSPPAIEITYFKVGGAFAARYDLFLGNSIFTKTSFGGYYIGNESIFNNKDIGYNNQGFCINHNLPGSGGGGFNFVFDDIVSN